MIFSENRYPLFGIMLQAHGRFTRCRRVWAAVFIDSGPAGMPGRSSRSYVSLPSMNPELLGGHFCSGHAICDFLKRDISRVIRIPMVRLLVNAEG